MEYAGVASGLFWMSLTKNLIKFKFLFSSSFWGAAQILVAVCGGDFQGQENRRRRFPEAGTASGKDHQELCESPARTKYLNTALRIISLKLVAFRPVLFYSGFFYSFFYFFLEIFDVYGMINFHFFSTFHWIYAAFGKTANLSVTWTSSLKDENSLFWEVVKT